MRYLLRYEARRAGITQPRAKPWEEKNPHPTFGHPLPEGERAGERGEATEPSAPRGVLSCFLGAGDAGGIYMATVLMWTVDPGRGKARPWGPSLRGLTALLVRARLHLLLIPRAVRRAAFSVLGGLHEKTKSRGNEPNRSFRISGRTKRRNSGVRSQESEGEPSVYSRIEETDRKCLLESVRGFRSQGSRERCLGQDLPAKADQPGVGDFLVETKGENLAGAEAGVVPARQEAQVFPGRKRGRVCGASREG